MCAHVPPTCMGKSLELTSQVTHSYAPTACLWLTRAISLPYVGLKPFTGRLNNASRLDLDKWLKRLRSTHRSDKKSRSKSRRIESTVQVGQTCFGPPVWFQVAKAGSAELGLVQVNQVHIGTVGPGQAVFDQLNLWALMNGLGMISQASLDSGQKKFNGLIFIEFRVESRPQNP